jgi:hypothetical protein
MLDLKKEQTNGFHLPNQASESSGSIERLWNVTQLKKKPFLDSELLYQCITDATEAVYQENKLAFGNTSLSRT